jgi:DsrE/DsrF-like family
MKAAIVVLSDPNANSEEALGRVFNGLAAAYELKQNGDEVTVVFQGAGTRWLKLLSAPGHPVHGLFELVKDRVGGVSAACATVFGALEDVADSGLSLVSENAVPGTVGLASLRKWLADGTPVLIF